MVFMLCLEKLPCYSILKRFICSRVGILDSPWCNNSCRAYRELGQGDFYYSIRKKLPCPSIYLQPGQKRYYGKKNHAYLNLVYSNCHRVNIYRLVKLLNQRLL